MLSKDELDDFYKVAFTPYTEEEFAEYSKDRLIKSYLEITHAHNFELISLVRQWRDYFEGRGEKPTRKLWVLLRPGKNNDNAACSRLVEIANSFSAFEHGSTPYIPIIPLCIRSSISLVNFLDDFYFSPHILEANHHIKEFFTLIAYQGEPQMTKEAFAQQLHAEINAFIHECSCYADALGEYMFARVKEMEKPASAKPLQKPDSLQPATKDDVKKIVKSSEKSLAKTIAHATQGEIKTCHHPKKKCDALVQRVITRLATKGVTFSINNACKYVTSSPKERSALYDWCHRHSNEIRTEVDLRKSLTH